MVRRSGFFVAMRTRPCTDSALPPGIAIVSLARKEIDSLAADALGPIYQGDAAWPYQGARAVTVRGAGGELYEMVGP